MSEKTSSNKKPRAATVEDYHSEEDVEVHKTLKTASSNASANSAFKRSPQKPKGQHDQSRPASDAEELSRPHGTEKGEEAPPPERPAAEKPKKVETSSDPGVQRRHSTKPHSGHHHRHRNPERKPSKEGRQPSPGSEHRRKQSAQERSCRCEDCDRARATRHAFPQRPGPAPLQHGHAFTQPLPGYGYPPGPSPMMYPGQHPGGSMPPQPRPGPGARHSYHPGVMPGYGPGYPSMGPDMRTVDPRLLPRHMNPAPPTMAPPSLPPLTRRPSSPTKKPLKSAIRPTVHQSESYSTRTSNPQFTHKISTYSEDEGSSQEFEEEEVYSTRHIPQRRHVPGQYESPAGSPEFPPESPPSLAPVGPSRPLLPHSATTSEIRPILTTGRTRSSYSRDYPYERRREHRPEYPAEHTGYDDRRVARRHEPSYAHNYERDYRDNDYFEQRSSYSRRDSLSSGNTQPTFYSNPEQYMPAPEPRYEGRSGYVRQDPYLRQEDAARAYQDQARGGAEPRITAEALRQQAGGGPGSHVSQRSHRSRHSMSETSSRRGAEGSLKIRLPITGGALVDLDGDIGDRQISIRPTDDPEQVELEIGGPGREPKYYKSSTSASRSAAPTRSSGSSRQATRGRAESESQSRDHRSSRGQSRAPSSRKGP